MRFLVDRCAGRKLTLWLASQGHDARYVADLGPDPGDAALLAWAVQERRVVITIDTDFGHLIFASRQPHNGMIRLPDVPARERIRLVQEILARHSTDLDARAIITVKGTRIRITRSQPQ